MSDTEVYQRFVSRIHATIQCTDEFGYSMVEIVFTPPLDEATRYLLPVCISQRERLSSRHYP